jgi:hypothetical protein
MVDDLPDPIVLDDPDFLGLVVVSLFLVHKMARIRKWWDGTHPRVDTVFQVAKRLY